MTQLTHGAEPHPLDVPFEVAIAKANEAIAAGFTVYQKFTCSGCGSRLTIDEPNTFHRLGTCDMCPATTLIWKTGCGFLAVGCLSGTPSPDKGDPNAS